MPAPRAVIFDVDGTLIDTVDLHAEAWVETLEHFGIAATFEDMRVLIGKGGDQVLHGLIPPDDVERRGKEIADFRSELVTSKYLDRARPFPGVRALFERIRGGGQKIVLASSASAGELERYMDIAKIADLVDDTTSSADAEKSKPFPDIFKSAFDKLGLSSTTEAVVIGDTPYDAEAARMAGISSIGVLCGGFPENSLRSAGCAAIYRDPQHLLADYDASPLAKGF